MLILKCIIIIISEIGTTSLQGTKLLAPKCLLFGGSTLNMRHVDNYIGGKMGNLTGNMLTRQA